MKVFQKSAALLLSLCLLLTGCGGSGRIFTYYIPETPQNLDPQVASTPQELSTVSGLFSGLFSLDSSGAAVPCAAESYEISDSGLVYTIHLKEGLVYRYQGSSNKEEWQNVPVTADDYVFGIQRVFTPATKSPHTAALSAIQNGAAVLGGAQPDTLGISALDAHTLQITLSYPDPSFLQALAGAGAMPCNRAFFESTGGAYGLSKNDLLCNGPFDLRTWNSTDGVTLVSTQKKSVVSRVRFPIDNGSSTGLARYKKGDADMAFILPSEENISGATQSFATTTWVLLFNPATPGLNQAAVRQALAAVAHNTAASHPLSWAISPATGFVPSALTLNGGSYREAAGDAALSYTAENASLLFANGLSAAGLSKLSGIRAVIPEDALYHDVFETVNQNWQKELSAFFTVETKSQKEVLSAVAAGNYDIALIPVSAFSNDLYAYLQTFAAAPFAAAGNESYQKAMQALSNAVSTSGRLELAKQAEQALVQNSVAAPLLFENTVLIKADWLKSLYISPFGPTLELHSLLG